MEEVKVETLEIICAILECKDGFQNVEELFLNQYYFIVRLNPNVVDDELYVGKVADISQNEKQGKTYSFVDVHNPVSDETIVDRDFDDDEYLFSTINCRFAYFMKKYKML